MNTQRAGTEIGHGAGGALRAALAWLSEGQRLPPQGRALRWLIAALAVPLTLYEVWQALAGHAQPLEQAMVFVTAAYPVAFLTVSVNRVVARRTPLDWVLAALSLAAGGWFCWQAERYAQWIAGLDPFTTADLAAALVFLALTLELVRRCVGWGLTAVVLALLGYVFFGDHLQGTFSHRPFELAFFAEEMVISASGGVFGAPLQVAATYAFLFILFGKVLEAGGGGRYFHDLAAGLAGRRPGGVGKVAVVSSGLFGMLSGSPAADVMTTGSITIPSMRRSGYGAVLAGAVEAVASTGGSLLPPVMGAVVFLMAEFTAVPYLELAVAAAGVGLLYYLAVYLAVDLRARRLGLLGLAAAEIPRLRTTLLAGWYQPLPLLVLVAALAAGYSPAYVAALAFLSALAVSLLGPQRVGPRRLVRVCIETCYALAPLVAAVAAAGVVIGALNLTGLGGKLSTLVFTLTGGELLPSLLVAMAATIVLGMGMPVVAAYALVATLIAPVLVELGVPVLQAHLFLVYFSVLSAITPPVAIACYVASSIAQARPMAIAWQAVRLGAVAFVIPYLFIYQPALLLLGSPLENTAALAVAALAVALLVVALEGWWRDALGAPARLGLVGAAAALLLAPSGLALAAAACGAGLLWQRQRRRAAPGAGA